MNQMHVYIDSLRFQCILGILEHERKTPQDVIVDIDFTYNYTTKFVNYAEVTSEVKSLMIKRKFELIETAVLEISSFLKEKFPLINTLHIKISKPSILPDCTVSVGFVS